MRDDLRSLQFLHPKVNAWNETNLPTWFDTLFSGCEANQIAARQDELERSLYELADTLKWRVELLIMVQGELRATTVSGEMEQSHELLITDLNRALNSLVSLRPCGAKCRARTIVANSFSLLRRNGALRPEVL